MKRGVVLSFIAINSIITGCQCNLISGPNVSESSALLQHDFRYPSQIHEVLGMPSQQMLNGGILYETYILRKERILIEYHPATSTNDGIRNNAD